MARWANIEKVAEYTGYSLHTIRNKISKGDELGSLFFKLPSGARRADLDEVDSFMRESK